MLVCFALEEEARDFRQLAGKRAGLHILIVGMGKLNAERAIRAALAQERPDMVLTCGSAGGLRADLELGTVVFAADPETGLERALVAAGAQPARFHCAARVVPTAVEKRALRQATGADAVEMESEPICAVCREQHIPSATVRVILDTLHEDLPLDFNQVMTPDLKVSYAKVALILAKSPAKLRGLLQLRRQSQAAGTKLGQVLASVLGS